MDNPAVGDLFSSGPEQAHRRLVLLHGWGADADDLLDLGELLAGPDTHVVSLRAPLQHPAGMGRQWYDLQQPGWPELPQALVALRERLQTLAQSLPLQQTLVLGFSQGAAMALDVACGGGSGSNQDPLPLAGVLACSGYPHPDWQAGRRQPLASGLPVLLTHGEEDPVVPHGASLELQRLLNLGGAQVQLLSFKGGHTIDADLFAPMRSFMEHCWA